jgi:hypothetical protein
VVLLVLMVSFVLNPLCDSHPDLRGVPVDIKAHLRGPPDSVWQVLPTGHPHVIEVRSSSLELKRQVLGTNATHVRLCNLSTRPDLNGQEGILGAYHADAHRWEVRVGN